MSTTNEYSVKDVARLFDLQEARVRYWAQTGIVGPSLRRSGRAFYTFQDLIGIKVAKDLLDQGLSLQAVRKSLESLRAALPHVERPLTELRIVAEGDRVLVATQDAPYEAATGQVVMQFAVAALSERVAQVLPLPSAPPADAPPAARVIVARPPAPREPEPASAYAAFLAGVAAADADELERAEKLYRRAVELDEHLAAAWTNLASLLERRGARGEARSACEKALALDPEQPEARYNLANLLADVGELDEAIKEYRRVTASCPDFADAHFNLALIMQRTGQRAGARAHLARYLELDGESSWALRARALLDELDGAVAAT
jgi:tetratricopeptide (TPR) repeat protein